MFLMDSIVLREMKQEVIQHSILHHDETVIEVAVEAGMAKKTQKRS
jgi:hypothetical protein